MTKKIRDMLSEGPTFSIELFPPKSPEAQQRLRAALDELAELDLSFASVTYGAGGSTRDKTQETVEDVRRAGMTAMPHLTCIAHSRAELVDLLQGYRDAGYVNVLALHGDPPRDNPDIAAGELTRAVQLIELIREVGDFSVGAAAHPEGHPKAPDRKTDREHQAAKLKAADFGVTQFFFDAEDYLRLVDDLGRLGVETPIIPGIIPITNAGQVQKFAAMAGATVPSDLVARLDAAGDDTDEVRRIGVDVASDLGKRLLDEGSPGLHIYALNRSTATRELHANLGLPVG